MHEAWTNVGGGGVELEHTTAAFVSCSYITQGDGNGERSEVCLSTSNLMLLTPRDF